MLAIVIPVCLAILGLAFLLDTLNINAIAVIVVLGIGLRSSMFFEAALLIAVTGFVGTVALTKYLQRGDIIEF